MYVHVEALSYDRPPKMAKEWQDLLQRLATHIDRESGEGVMFSLWLFDTNRQVGSQHYFTSSVEREDVIVQLATWLAMQLDSAEISQTHPTCLLYTSPSPRDS